MEITKEEVIAYLKKMNYSEERINSMIGNPVTLEGIKGLIATYKDGINQINKYADPFETLTDPEKVNEPGLLSGRKF